MNIDRILVNFGVIRRFETEVEMTPEDFVRKFRGLTRMENPFDFSGRLSDAFSTDNRFQYVGMIHANYFQVRLRRRQVAGSVASGLFRMEGDKLKIQTEVSSLTTMWKVYFILTAIFVVSTVVNLMYLRGMQFLIIPFLIWRIAFFVALPLLWLRYVSNSLTSQLQMEFRYIKNRP